MTQLRTALLGFLRAVLTVLVLLDEIARPFYRPLARWIAGLRIVARMEAAIARLPRPAILILLAIPFAVAEPLKIVGVIMIGRGQAAAGIVVLALAYLASFLLVERIFHAGRDKLMSYAWLDWGITLLADIRNRLLGWVRASAGWRAAIDLRDGVRRWWRDRRGA